MTKSEGKPHFLLRVVGTVRVTSDRIEKPRWLYRRRRLSCRPRPFAFVSGIVSSRHFLATAFERDPTGAIETQLAAMPMSTSAMPMAKYFAAVKKKPIITANVFTAVPPSHTAKKPAMKNPKMPSFVRLSPPGSFSVDTLNTVSAMRLVSPLARATSDRPRCDEAWDAWDAHASAAACSAPAETPGTRRDAPGVARADARARIATRAEGAERPVVLGFVLREMPRVRDARDPARGMVVALIECSARATEIESMPAR